MPRESRIVDVALLRDAAERSIRYLSGIDARAVRPDPSAVTALVALREPLPAGPRDPAAVLARLDTLGSPATLATAGARFFGFVIGGAMPVTVAANWLATAWDQNTAFWDETPTTAILEEVALAWMLDLLGLPAGTACAFVTGATMANFTALAAARHSVLTAAGWDVEGAGLFGAPPITVIIGDEAHPTVLKSLGLLGLGRTRVVRVPADSQGRMRAEAFPSISGPTIVCMQAGNVNTGAIDPFADVVPRAREAGAWVHVDGAIGLWAAASPARASRFAGMSLADSWATDAHKWLNTPYDCGLAFVRDGDALRAAMAITAEYLPDGGTHRHPSDHTPELSRRARGVEVWAALSALGRSGVVEMVERCCRHARRFAEGLAADGHVILNDVTLNQVLVDFGDPDTTRRTIAALQADGTCWAGGTVWHGRTAMRISVSGWATTDADVEASLAAMRRAVRGAREP